MKRWQRKHYIFLAIIVAIVLIGAGWRLIAERRHRVAEGLVKNPPWLMWGNSQVFEVPLTLGQAQTTTGQLVKISYARPEAWRFLFTARVIAAPVFDPNLHPTMQLIVDFNVDTGIGRSTARLDALPNSTNQPGFERYIFAGSPIDPLAANAFKWSTTVNGPPRDDLNTNYSNITEVIVGQDIQISVQIFSSCDHNEPNLSLEVGAWFSPNVHIRPEWFKGRMANIEDEGR